MKIRVYLNTNIRNSFVFGWTEGDPMRLAFEFDVTTGTLDHLCNWCYREFNVDEPGEIGKRYRAASNRSLSMGDVLAFEGTGKAFAVADVGWTEIDPDKLTVVHENKLAGLVKSAKDAAYGDSNDTEIELLQEALDEALSQLGRAGSTRLLGRGSRLARSPRLDVTEVRFLGVARQATTRERNTTMGKSAPRTTRLKAGSAEWRSLIGVAAEALSTKGDLYVTVKPTGVTGNRGLITLSVDPPR
jgi:hypothetical protein